MRIGELNEKGQIDKQIKLRFFQDLYTTAKTAMEKTTEQFDKNYAQYKGSLKIDDSLVDAKTGRNITYELVESQVSSYIPKPSVTAKNWSEKRERNAKSVETLLGNMRNRLPFEKMNDLDERYSPIYGGSIWLVEWDNSIMTHNTVGDVKVSLISPKHFIGQPNLYEIDEMEYCFIDYECSKDELVRKYGVKYQEIEDLTSAEHGESDETCTVKVCYYKNEADKICQYIWSDDTVLSDIDDYYSRKVYVCKNCGKRKELCTCDKPDYEAKNSKCEELDRNIPLSDGSVLFALSEVIEDGRIVTEITKSPVIRADGTVETQNVNGVVVPLVVETEVPKTERTELPYYTPTKFPVVIRKNTSTEDSLWGQSDVEIIRPQQQEINKLQSRISDKLMKGGVYALVPDDFVDDLNDSIYGKTFRCKQATKNLFGKIDLQANVQQDMQQVERIYDHAKRILGISDSFQGQEDSTATSGVAKQIQVNQSAGRLESKHKMKNAAYSEMDEVTFQLYLAYADEPRQIAYKDGQGRMQNITFNKYDFLERDESGEYYYDDEYLFATDSAGDMENNRTTLWQENRLNYQSGAYGDPAQPETQLIFWQNMERAHYPNAKDNVERITEIMKGQTAQLQAQLAEKDSIINDMGKPENVKRYYSEVLGGAK